MKFKQLIFILFLLALNPYQGKACQAPNLHFRHFSQEQNFMLGQNVNAMACDSNGFMWFGTDEGLYRFDGYQLKAFQSSQSNPVDFSGKQITSLLADDNNCLWISTSDGTYLYNLKKNKTKILSIVPELDTTRRYQHYFAKFLYMDAEGQIYMATREHLYLYDTKYKYFRRFNPLQTKDPKPYSAILKDKNHNLWIATFNEGIYLVNKEGTIEQFSKNSEMSKQIKSNTVVSLAADNSYLYFSTYNGISAISLGNTKGVTNFNNSDQKMEIGKEPITRLYTDAQRNLWVCTEAGLFLLNKEEGNFWQYRNEPDLESSLGSDKVKNIIEDQQGNLWVFSLGGGISYAGFNNSQAFEWYYKRSNSTKGLSNNMVNAFAEDESRNIWIGTDGGGLNYFDQKAGEFKYFTNQFNNSSIQSNAITSLYIDSDDQLWVGTFNGGLSRYNANGTFTTWQPDDQKPGSISSGNVMAICEGKNHQILMMTLSSGLNVYDQATRQFEVYRNGEPGSNTISHNGGTSVLCDSYGLIWIGTFNGLSCWDQEHNQFRNFYSDRQNPNSLCNNYVYSVFEDQYLNIWVGTKTGISLFDRKKNDLTKPNGFSEIDGKSVVAIFGDKNNAIYFLTPNEGYVLLPGKKELYSLNLSGNLSGYINKNACLKCSNGKVLIGTTKGFAIFDPQKFQPKPPTDKVILTDFRIFDQSVKAGDTINGRVILNKDISVDRQVTIYPGEKNFSLEFTSVNYLAPDKMRYAYMLKGFDRDWRITTAGMHSASYTNLAAGNYVFMVKDASPNSQSVSQVKIKILTYWWLTRWAFVCYFIILFVLIFVYFKISMARIRLRKDLEVERLRSEKEAEMSRMKTSFFTHITHEFRTPLTLISGPVEILIEKYQNQPLLQKHLGVVKKSADRLLLLINELLELRRYESQKMELHASGNEIVTFTRQVAQSFQSQADIQSIEFSIVADDEEIQCWFDKTKLEKVIFNLVSNAFKYTPKGGTITVNIEKSTDKPLKSILKFQPTQGFVKITISDTGIGIPEKELEKIFESFYTVGNSQTQSSGIGLSLARQIVDLHAGTIEVVSLINEGTRFVVWLPLGNEHLTEKEKMPIREVIASPVKKNGNNQVETIDESEKNGSIELPLLLIVEDNHELREFLKMELEPTYQIIEADNGTKALQLAFDSIPDLVISDVMMPEMDGLELCRRLKEDDKTNHIPVILLTARGTIEHRVEGLESGADSYISKPFHPRHLEVRIRKLIESRQLLRDKLRAEILKNEPGLANITSNSGSVFIEKAQKVIEENLNNPDFTVEMLSDSLHLSYTQLYRKLKSVSGLTIAEFILSLRLKKACQLLIANNHSISEVCYEVGFSSPSYFTKCFREQFNLTPTEYCDKYKGH